MKAMFKKRDQMTPEVRSQYALSCINTEKNARLSKRQVSSQGNEPSPPPP